MYFKVGGPESSENSSQMYEVFLKWAVLSVIGVFKATTCLESTYFGSIKECVEPVAIRNLRGFVWGSLIFMKGSEGLRVAGLMYPVGFPRQLAENSKRVVDSLLYCSD